MGRSYTPRYAISFNSHPGMTRMAWQVRKSGQRPGDGQPSTKNIQRFVDAFEASLLPGGPNAHLGSVTILEAWIVDQHDDNRCVAEWARN